MFELSVTNHRGEALSLSHSNQYTVYRIEGLTPPQATVNQSVNATVDGANINSVRVNSRNIVLYLAIEGDVEANRINLYKYFPVKKSVKLYFKNGKREVKIEGIVELIECDVFTMRQTAQISIICPKPYFNAVNDIVSYFSQVNRLFSFPFSIPESGVEFSAITTNVRQSIINYGDIETGAIIELFAIGQVVNPVIYDVDKRTFFKLNMTLEESDLVTINTNIGEKSVTLLRNGVISNAIGYMSSDSSWFQVEAGDNVFTYNCDAGNTNLQITFRTATLYEGV